MSLIEAGLIAGMVLLTFVPRYLPFAFAGKINIPPLLERAFQYIPIAVLSAIVIQTVMVRDGHLAISLDNHYLWSAGAAFITALFCRRPFIVIAVGLIVYGIVRLFDCC